MKIFKRFLDKATSHEGPCENYCDKCRALLRRAAFWSFWQTVMVCVLSVIVLASAMGC